MASLILSMGVPDNKVSLVYSKFMELYSNEKIPTDIDKIIMDMRKVIKNTL